MVSIGVSSSAFEHEGTIPSKYTCDGEDMSPPLKFTDVPANTKSIVLICDDPDAPKGTWVHWVVIDLPGDTKNLPENVLIADYSGAIEGMNSWGKTGYGGACPPSGIHRYYFKVYALDTKLGLTSKATKEDVLKKIEANNKKHLLGYGELMGRYSRTK